MVFTVVRRRGWGILRVARGLCGLNFPPASRERDLRLFLSFPPGVEQAGQREWWGLRVSPMETDSIALV